MLIFAAGFLRVAAAGFPVARARLVAGFLRVCGVAAVRFIPDADRPRAGVGLSIFSVISHSLIVKPISF